MESIVKRLMETHNVNESETTQWTPEEIKSWMEKDSRVAEELATLFSNENIIDLRTLRRFVDRGDN